MWFVGDVFQRFFILPPPARGWRLSKLEKGKKSKIFWYPTQKKTRPGPDGPNTSGWYGWLVGWFRLFRWSTLINYDSNLLMRGAFLIKLILPTNNRELQKRPLIWICLQLLWTFDHFAPQQLFFVQKNCTILFCFHPLPLAWPFPFRLSRTHMIALGTIGKWQARIPKKINKLESECGRGILCENSNGRNP